MIQNSEKQATTVSRVTTVTLPADLENSRAAYGASTLTVASAARRLDASEIDNRLLGAWFDETRPAQTTYQAGWLSACDRFARMDADFETDDGEPPNLADLRDHAHGEVRRLRRELQWHRLHSYNWTEQQQTQLIVWHARFDAARVAVELSASEGDQISSLEIARILRLYPSVPLVRAEIRLRQRIALNRWRAGR